MFSSICFMKLNAPARHWWLTLVILAGWEAEIGEDQISRLAWANRLQDRISKKLTRVKRTGGAVQTVEGLLLCEREALSLNLFRHGWVMVYFLITRLVVELSSQTVALPCSRHRIQPPTPLRGKKKSYRSNHSC
jgi:hypothetical protein